MKKTIIASLAVLASAALLATFALGEGPKVNAIFEAKATEKSFTFNATVGKEQFEKDPAALEGVKVKTGSSDPIRTLFMPIDIKSFAFGENERFVEAQPIANKDKPHYSLTIDINNLTHFAIDMGVANDVGIADTYSITLLDDDGKQAGYWNSHFELDGSGNDTKHIEWDKGDYDGTVVLVLVQLYFKEDFKEDWESAVSLYVDSLSLTWNC